MTELRKVTDDGCDLLLEWESGESFRVRAPHLDYGWEVARGTVGSTVIARGRRAQPPYDLIADTVERIAS
ncbi:MAG: hypothetical protein ACREQM_08475 [Candidatus Dormibacteraceae bacterium]